MYIILLLSLQHPSKVGEDYYAHITDGETEAEQRILRELTPAIRFKLGTALFTTQPHCHYATSAQDSQELTETTVVLQLPSSAIFDIIHGNENWVIIIYLFEIVVS